MGSTRNNRACPRCRGRCDTSRPSSIHRFGLCPSKVAIHVPNPSRAISATDGSRCWRDPGARPSAACRRLQGHARRDRAAVVRAGLSRPRRQHGAIDLARGAGRLMPGRRAVADQPLHRPQGRLGLRRRHHGLHLVLCDLDELAQSRHRAHADDHPREQLHAVDGQFRRLLHRRHAGFGLCRLHHHQSAIDVRAADAGLGVLHRRARGHDGHPDEAADDQYRAAALPFRHRGG